ncbi:MAG: L,D-transpeptidase family protein [Patescibacteria group bacterium]
MFLLSLMFASTLASSADEGVLDGFKFYKIKEGDLLSKIAPFDHWSIIQKVNRIDERHLVPGKIIYIPVDLDIASGYIPLEEINYDVINDPRAIVFFIDSQFFGAYEHGKLIYWGPISSGRKGHETPRGDFFALWKSKNYFSKKYQVPMPYAVNILSYGIFFHEQAMPGKPDSHGCIRMLRLDAKQIFTWIQKNDRVLIR